MCKFDEIMFSFRVIEQRVSKNLYVGGRFLTPCEVSYLSETTYFNKNPSENLNDATYVLSN